MTPDELAKQRMQFIAKRQELLERAVNGLQESLYEAILVNITKIADDPARLEALFNQFTKKYHLKVINQFANDIFQIGKQNSEYFKGIFEGEIPKNYAAIKANADTYLLDRFGLSPSGNIVPEGFIDSFIKDPSIKRELKSYAYKAQSSVKGLEEFKKGFRDIIKGTENSSGVVKRYYNTYSYDTYQQADAVLQNQYSTKLGLTAALYLGGVIEGTRPFCKERNGKVWIKSEIETWATLTFSGKPKNYDPFQDRGGYGCRHHLNYITDKMAMRRRDDLEINSEGVLISK